MESVDAPSPFHAPRSTRSTSSSPHLLSTSTAEHVSSSDNTGGRRRMPGLSRASLVASPGSIFATYNQHSCGSAVDSRTQPAEVSSAIRKSSSATEARGGLGGRPQPGADQPGGPRRHRAGSTSSSGARPSRRDRAWSWLRSSTSAAAAARRCRPRRGLRSPLGRTALIAQLLLHHFASQLRDPLGKVTNDRNDRGR